MASPVLADRFFVERRPTGAFFQQWQDEGPWSSGLLPIYEWEGILFVATCDPQNVAPHSNWCLVQANPDALLDLWNEWTGGFVQASQPYPTLSEEASIPALSLQEAEPAAALFQLNESDEVLPEHEHEHESEHEPVAAPTESQPRPLVHAKPPESEDEHQSEASSHEEEGHVHVPDEEKLSIPTDAKTISLDSLTRTGVSSELTSEAAVVPATVAPVLDTPMLTNLRRAPEANDETHPKVELAAMAGANTRVPHSLRAKPEPPQKLAAAPTQAAPKAGPAAQAPKAPAASAPAPASSAPRAVPAAAKKPTPPTAARGDEWTDLWSSLGSSFEHSMILLFQDGQVIPWKWDPGLKPEKPDLTHSIQIPSPFRIAAKTQKSYHGYLVPNEVSDAFFRNWNRGQYPEHLTLSPVMQDELVKGFIFAWGTSRSDTKECLHLVEGTSVKIAPRLLKQTDVVKSA